MGKNQLIIGIVLVVLLVAGGFIAFQSMQERNASDSVLEDSSEQTENPTQNTDSESSTQNETGVKQFIVNASNFKFDLAEIRVNEGDAIKVTVRNTGGIHDFTIDEFDAKTKQIPSGQEETIEFVADKTGEYEFYCSVGNHREMGMKGKLIVE